MPITKVYTYANEGLQSHLITIEGDTNRSLPSIDIIGLPDLTIRESKERIRATFRNFDIPIPPQKIILNLAPSNIKKIGTRFDLPIAVAVLGILNSNNQSLKKHISQSIFFGELGLDGSVKCIDGLLPSVLNAYKNGWKHFFIPKELLNEVIMIPGIYIYTLDTFGELYNHLLGNLEIIPIRGSKDHVIVKKTINRSLSNIKGHILPKRAISIAAGGLHNILMIGPPGTGKSMLAKAIGKLLPSITFNELLEVNAIYSVAGLLSEKTPLIHRRPFRKVHHTASKIALIGGGIHMKPGEVSLSHQGVLFLDEIAEFSRETLEVLRQPIEDREVRISRANGSVQYPSSFMVVAAMNPCKCGFYGDKNNTCICSNSSIKSYQSKISGPLLDRFDIIIQIPRENISTVLGPGVDTVNYGSMIDSAWEKQRIRYNNESYTMNGQLSAQMIDTYLILSTESESFLKKSVEALNLSPRVVHRIMKVARTIADLEGDDLLSPHHLAEAMQYRTIKLFV